MLRANVEIQKRSVGQHRNNIINTWRRVRSRLTLTTSTLKVVAVRTIRDNTCPNLSANHQIPPNQPPFITGGQLVINKHHKHIVRIISCCIDEKKTWISDYFVINNSKKVY